MDVQSDRCNFFPVSTKVYPYSEEGQDTRRANFWKLLSNKQFIKVKAPDNDDEVFFLYLYVMPSICILLQVCGIKLENPRKSLLLWHFSKIKNYDTNRITLKKTLKLRLLGFIFKHSLTLVFKMFLIWCQVVRINDFLKS